MQEPKCQPFGGFGLSVRFCPLPESTRETALGVEIDPNLAHPHSFRHTYGRNSVLKGVLILALQKWLGHQSLKDTQPYVELASAHHEWGAGREPYLLAASPKLENPASLARRKTPGFRHWRKYRRPSLARRWRKRYRRRVRL